MKTGTDLQTSLSALPRWSRAVGGMTMLRGKPAGQAVPLLGARGSRARATMTVGAAPWLHTWTPAPVAWQLLGWPFVASCMGVLPAQKAPAAALASMPCCLSTACQTTVASHWTILSYVAGQSTELEVHGPQERRI